MAWPFALLLVFGFFASIAGSLWLANPPDTGRGRAVRRHAYVRIPVRLLGGLLAVALIGGGTMLETASDVQRADPPSSASP